MGRVSVKVFFSVLKHAGLLSQIQARTCNQIDQSLIEFTGLCLTDDRLIEPWMKRIEKNVALRLPRYAAQSLCHVKTPCSSRPIKSSTSRAPISVVA